MKKSTRVVVVNTLSLLQQHAKPQERLKHTGWWSESRAGSEIVSAKRRRSGFLEHNRDSWSLWVKFQQPKHARQYIIIIICILRGHRIACKKRHPPAFALESKYLFYHMHAAIYYHPQRRFALLIYIWICYRRCDCFYSSSHYLLSLSCMQGYTARPFQY